MKDDYKSLAPQTAKVLSALSELSELQNFTLVGGSALSIHLEHRISEDLDFFTWFEKLDAAETDTLIKQISKSHSVKILNTFSEGIGIMIGKVKVTLFANNWDKLKIRERLNKNLFIGKLELVTAMKINALSLRAKFRDYYDYILLLKKFLICIKSLTFQWNISLV